MLNILILTFINCSFVTKGNVSDYLRVTDTLEIHFQGSFQNDTVSLRIGDKSIFEKKTLVSYSLMQRAALKIVLVKQSDRCAIVRFEENCLSMKDLESPLKITVTINRKKISYTMKNSSIEFLGVYNDGEDELIFFESKRPFLYH